MPATRTHHASLPTLIGSLAVLALGLALLMGGCGGGTEVGSADGGGRTEVVATPKPTPTAPWTELASDRCAQFADEQVAVRKKYSAPELDPEKAIDGALREGMEVMAQMTADLRGIEVPGEAKKAWNSWIEGWEQTAAAMPMALQEQLSGVTSPELEKTFEEVGDKILPAQEQYDLGACEELAAG